MKKRLVFAGAGELIELLIGHVINEFEVEVILSKTMSPGNLEHMKRFCLKHKIKYQFGFKGLDADLISTINYPMLIKKQLVDNHLFVNAHFALLPKYRGYHPVQCALLNDDQEIGYTVHRVDEGMDRGPIFFQHRLPVTDEDNIHTLNNSLTDHLVRFFPEYVRAILAGQEPVKQDESKALYGGKRRPEDGLIDWHESSKYIFNLVRAVCPPFYPGAFTYWQNEKVIITRTVEMKVPAYRHIPGQLLNIDPKQGFLVKTGDTALWISEIMTAGGEVGPPQQLLSRNISHKFTMTPE